jgi:hypothetical protein
MRCFGRQCRGIGHVFVTLVRRTETHLLEMGEPHSIAFSGNVLSPIRLS